MFVTEITAALMSGLILTGAVFLLARRRYEVSILWLFLLTFLGAWTGGVWMRPAQGVGWLPFILTGLAVALGVALTSRKVPRNRQETLDLLEEIERERALRKVTVLSMNIYFIILAVIFAGLILIRYGLNG